MERHKRIRQLDDGCNRIERCYRLLDSTGRLIDEFTTVDVIRPYAPDALREMLLRNGYRVCGEAFDYGSGTACDAARFCSVLATAG